LPPLSTIARAASRSLTQLATAGEGGHGPGGVAAPVDPQLQKRFQDALTQEKLARDGKASTPISQPSSVGGGKGQKTKEAKKNLEMLELAREYPFAYKNTGRAPTGAATVLWHPKLFAADGSANVSFDLSPSGTGYRIILLGNSPSGRLGSFQGKLQAK